MKSIKKWNLTAIMVFTGLISIVFGFFWSEGQILLTYGGFLLGWSLIRAVYPIRQ